MRTTPAATDPPTSADRSFGPTETLMLVGLATMWGGSFLFVEVALGDGTPSGPGLTPLWIVTGRCLVGGLVLLLVLRIRRRKLPATRQLWGRLIILGAASNALPWGAIAWAQQSLPSGLTALLMALVPSSTLVVAAAMRQERFTPLRLLGLLLALGGVGLTVFDDVGDPERVIAILVVVTATLLYACGAVFAKGRVSGTAAPLAIATGQVISAFLITLPIALLVEPLPDLGDIDLAIGGSILALGALGTGGAFLLFYVLIERVGATNTTMVTYLIPVIAVLLGALVLDERIGLASLAGGALIGLGIWVTQRGSPPRRAASPPVHQEEPHP